MKSFTEEFIKWLQTLIVIISVITSTAGAVWYMASIFADRTKIFYEEVGVINQRIAGLEVRQGTQDRLLRVFHSFMTEGGRFTRSNGDHLSSEVKDNKAELHRVKSIIKEMPHAWFKAEFAELKTVVKEQFDKLEISLNLLRFKIGTYDQKMKELHPDYKYGENGRRQ